MTGVSSSRPELLILADKDVRYTLAGLQKLLGELEGADYPGTFGVRRAALIRTGRYDGDVLFENLEMLRTIRAAGGQEVIASDL